MFLTPLEAFHHLRQIIERVNALVSQLSNADAFAKAEMNKKNKTDCNGSNESKEKEQLKEELTKLFRRLVIVICNCMHVY